MDRDFLFGVIAVQLGQASPAQVMAAASAHVADRSKSVAERLVDDGAISQDRRDMLDAMVDDAVKAHGGDVRQTMETLGGDRAVYASFGGSIAVDQVSGDVTIISAPDEIAEEIEVGRVTLEQPGKYRVAEGAGAEIGRGGIGRVLVAFDEHLGREIAIKELLAETEGADVSTPKTDRISRTGAIAARFLREARVTGQLEHPNIVPVYEVGQRDSGAYYYTMKLVRGRTLAAALKDCRGLGDRLKLLHHYVDLCNAVAYAHSRGVVHRDIKTENVMLGEFGETVVLDWGLAKVKGKQDIRGGAIERELKLLHDAGTGQTVDGSAIGTPAYMSPEQADGRVEEIDERSDIWSLGAVLYEVLTGKPPFEGYSPYEIIGKVLKEDIVPPAQRSNELPAELSAVAVKALTRDKAGRYAKAEELASEINAYMSGGRIAAYRYSTLELLRAFVSQHKAASVLVLLIVALAVAGAGVLYDAYEQAGAARDRAEEQRVLAEDERAHAHRNEQQAMFNLAAAFQEKAEGLFDDRDMLSSRIYSAAALFHHPCGTVKDTPRDRCDERYPDGSQLRVRAVSNVYQTSLNLLARPSWVHRGGSEIYKLEFSRDGRTVATIDHDALIHLWDLEERRELLTLQGSLKAPENGMALSADGQTIAGCEGSTRIVLWSRDGRRLATLEQPAGEGRALAFSPLGDLLAASSEDGTVNIWDLKTMKTRHSLSGSRFFAFSPDGRTIAIHRDGKRVDLVEVSSGKTTASIDGFEGIWCLEFSADGRLLVAGTVHQTVEIADTATGAHLKTLRGHREAVSSATFSPDGRLLVSGSGDKTIRFWSTDNWELRYLLDAHAGPVEDLAFSPDGRTLASVGEDGALRRWDLQTQGMARVLGRHEPRGWRHQFSREGRLLASGGDDGAVRVWDVASGDLQWEDRLSEGAVSDVAFVGDDDQLVAVHNFRIRRSDSTLRVYDVATGKLSRLIDGASPFSVSVSPDGNSMVTGGRFGETTLWDLAAGRVVKTLDDEAMPGAYVSFSPDGRFIASGGADKSVRVWDARSGKRIHTLEGHSDTLYNYTFSADGSDLLSTGRGGTIIQWDIDRGVKVRELVGHQRWVNVVRFVPGGKLIVSCSDDGTVRLWDRESAKQLLIIKTKTGGNDVAVSPDGKTLAIRDLNMIVLYPLDLSLYDRDPAQLHQEVEQEAGKKLEGFALVPLE